MCENKRQRAELSALTAPRFIPLNVPELRGNEWKYIKECLDTNWVSSVGPFVDRFEREVADYVGMKHAVATVNGTAALHIALLVAGVQPDDEVLVSTLTFAASANAIRYVGAWPVFMDADPLYWQMDPEKLADFTTKRCDWQNGKLVNKVTGRRVTAILPVHVLGHACDMDLIEEVARRYDLVVIEDAAEGLGVEYKGRKVGKLGDIACLSFNGNKLITTGGGGMVLTSNQAWAARARYLTTQAKDDPIEFAHGEIGYNYRLTNIQAALGCAQMEQLHDFIVAKRAIAGRYTQALSTLPGVTCMKEAPWMRSTFWAYTILVDPGMYGEESRTLLRRLDSMGIQTRPLWQPLHLSSAHRYAESYRCDVSEQLYHKALSLPSSVGLTQADQRIVIRALSKLEEESHERNTEGKFRRRMSYPSSNVRRTSD